VKKINECPSWALKVYVGKPEKYIYMCGAELYDIAPYYSTCAYYICEADIAPYYSTCALV
jgi:hypothetical protein